MNFFSEYQKYSKSKSKKQPRLVENGQSLEINIKEQRPQMVTLNDYEIKFKLSSGDIRAISRNQKELSLVDEVRLGDGYLIQYVYDPLTGTIKNKIKVRGG